jgi:excisionase family DNA binding protein
MNAEEAAEYLAVSVGRFRDAASKGEIDRYRDIGGWRYHRDDLDRWRRSRREGPRPC